jgi:hypothetical protein
MTTCSTHRNGKEYRYYRCVTRGKQGSRACTTRQLPAEAIEGFVVGQLKEAIQQGRISTATASARLHRLEATQQRLRAERAPLQEGAPASGSEVMQTLLELDRALAQGEPRIQEASWLVETLSEFESLWEVFTPRNRQRLVRILVEEVVVDEREGEVRVRLTDLEERVERDAGRAS